MLLLPTLFRERKAVEVRWDHKNGITRAQFQYFHERFQPFIALCFLPTTDHAPIQGIE
jgi:hypothetical protein